ncbi:hypothetical protein DFH07DRAFT_1056052 [Mycena maculata]|uniref:Fungal-type protein kinase domain-containing protein n=1 Tax=Mycena maculata TaxID=230809 RepID=A0AAD7K587_9AGAR|nr:hypothetical protein DFH07DRAFT_1056052 [Mycena maculata]
MSQPEPELSDSATSTSMKSRQVFVEPLFDPSSYTIKDVRAVFTDMILMTHYVHSNFPDLLNDTLSLSNIRFDRRASGETVGVLVDLDGVEHPSNPLGHPSTHGTIPFTAYDLLVQRRKKSESSWNDERSSLHTAKEVVNAAAPYDRYCHILEALFYILLWCISDVPNQTLGWMELGHVARHQLLCLVKHPKERESFMWDATDAFAQISAEFQPLIEVWLIPLWMLLSEAQFACRLVPDEQKSEKLDGILTWDKIADIIRGEGVNDLRIAALIPVPGEDDSDSDAW